MTRTIRIAGFGGQGVMLLGQIIAYAATLKNLNSTWVPTYGPETRGGTANCMVTISSEQVYSPVFNHCDDLIVFNAPSFHKFKLLVKDKGKIYYNSSLVSSIEQSTVNTIAVACNDLALDLENSKVINIIMLGRYMKDLNLFGESEVESALLHFFGESKKELIPINIKAFRLGQELK
jgi:2-oxoglutarate ferredoxin oxidoreductase subunit gamma